MKRRVLFVDDDPNVLEGLKRTFHPLRDQWEMEFVGGGPEALARLQQARMDVVVSDMRMPRMNGLQLMAKIKTLYPHTVRILLSGESDEDAVTTPVDPTHQYLAKPCDAETLKGAISRACTLGDLLGDDRLKLLVSQIDSMPSLPALYAELLQELQAPEPSMQKVSRIISRDLGMTAKILKVVNSAFFGLPQQISDPSQAAVYLGLDTLKLLVLGVQVFQNLGHNPVVGLSFDGLWQHSLTAAEIARTITRAERPEPRFVDDAFAAGMLHDIGILLLAAKLPERYQEALTRSKQENLPLETAERDMLGATHAEVGAYLLGLWGLGNYVVEAVAYHHIPSSCAHRSFSPLTAVHVANALTEEQFPIGLERDPLGLDSKYLAELKLSARVPEWRALIAHLTQKGET